MRLYKTPRFKLGVFFLISLAAMVFSLSCSSIGKIYPKEKLAQELERICREEYNLNVKARLLGGTLAGCLTLDYIYPEKINYKVGFDLKNQLTILMYKYKKLESKVERSLNNFLVAVTRVALSTDAKIDFFEAVILDRQNGIERIYIGYITDTKRLKYEDISLTEGGKRIIYDTRLNPKIVGESIVRGFFSDMEKKTSDKIISEYFLNTKREDLSDETFLDFIRENDYKKDRIFRLDKLDAVRLSKDRSIIKCNVWQSFTPKEGFENFVFKFPRFFRNEYLFLINTANLIPIIEKVVILFENTPEGGFSKMLLGEDISKLLSETKEEFFFDEIEFPDFLAGQIAQRIIYEFNLHPYMIKDFYAGYSKGEFLKGEGSLKGAFRFTVDISEKKFLDIASLFEMTLKKSRQDKTPSDPFTMALEGFLEKLSESGKKHFYMRKDINSLIFKIIADILYSYDFKEFNRIELVNLAYTEKVFVEQKELMDYRKKIKLR
ncbi:MAG: hypothetical protein FJZ16_00790 [Candidatus Omnitrophica bacterium]|nr:hypothetical protein [Candidatus Omnitrophota bacterium]